LSNPHLCHICKKPVALELAKADEQGRAVHAECYLLKISATCETLISKWRNYFANATLWQGSKRILLVLCHATSRWLSATGQAIVRSVCRHTDHSILHWLRAGNDPHLIQSEGVNSSAHCLHSVTTAPNSTWSQSQSLDGLTTEITLLLLRPLGTGSHTFLQPRR